MIVELIFDPTCPNVGAARRQIRDALEGVGRPRIWTEWDRAAPEAPAHTQRYASPTVLVGGRDVVSAGELDGSEGCRVFGDASGAFAGAPTVDAIVAALTTAEPAK